jgi:CRP-like cAMP-binding protein
VIQLGSVRITHKTHSGEEIVVATLGTGSVFGEMALLDGDKRSAVAECIERTEIVRIDYNQFHKLLTDHPLIAAHFHRAVAVFLSGRLRITTADLSFSRELNLRRLQ